MDIKNPKVGDIAKAREVGRSSFKAYTLLTFVACPICGKTRWVSLYESRKDYFTGLCRSCSCKTRLSKGKFHQRGEKCSAWKGGRSYHQGYIYVMVYDDNFFYPMAIGRYKNNGYVAEHRLVMAKKLGRCLQRWEIVHHKNGIRDDNRIENLELHDGVGNHILAHTKGYQDGFNKGCYDGKDKRIKELETRIKELESR